MNTIFKTALIVALTITQVNGIHAQTDSDTTAISFTKDGRPLGNGNGGIGSHKTPARNTPLLYAAIVKSSRSIHFRCFDMYLSAPFYIYDKNSILVLSGNLVFDEAGECTVSINSMSSGTFTLLLELGNSVYEGVFTKEED